MLAVAARKGDPERDVQRGDLVVIAEFAGLALHVDGLAPEHDAALAARFALDAALFPSTDALPNGHVEHTASIAFTTGARDEFYAGPLEHFEETFALAFAGGAVSFSGRLVRGSFGGTRGDAVIAPVTAEHAVGAVENVLRIATAQLVLARGGLLLHSAAIADGDEAIVLVGKSGAGKSTACATAKRLGRRVLSDELNALFVSSAAAPVPSAERVSRAVYVSPVPFAGDFGEAPTHARFRVRGLFLLEQGDDTVRTASRAHAAGALLAAAPFVNTDAARTDTVLAAALAIAAHANVRVLSLALGSDAWSLAALSRDA